MLGDLKAEFLKVCARSMILKGAWPTHDWLLAGFRRRDPERVPTTIVQ